jgi:hypothetical protein
MSDFSVVRASHFLSWIHFSLKPGDLGYKTACNCSRQFVYRSTYTFLMWKLAERSWEIFQLLLPVSMQNHMEAWSASECNLPPVSPATNPLNFPIWYVPCMQHNATVWLEERITGIGKPKICREISFFCDTPSCDKSNDTKTSFLCQKAFLLCLFFSCSTLIFLGLV